MEPREISIHFLLNIDEDFDDDLLYKVTEISGYESAWLNS